MAKVKYNVVTHGVSGNFADLIQFRQRHGKTIFAKIAQGSKAPTQGQLDQRAKFKQATVYAKLAIKNPVVLPFYQRNAAGDITPYTLAIRDFFTAPQINSVNTETYTGSTGSLIEITATDDTKVEKVSVQVLNSSQNLLEQGEATLDAQTGTWKYTTTVANSNVAGSHVIIEAQDLPGNTTRSVVTL